MTAKLNQIIAIEKGIKSRCHSELSELYKAVQKPELFNGFQKTYQSLDEAGESLPPERKRVQLISKDVLQQTQRIMSELFDVTARKDYTNCTAKATVTVDGNVILRDAPVSYLLFLEKQLVDLRTFVGHLPVLDEQDDWRKDENTDLFKTDVTQTHRTKKVQRPIVLYAATEQHPAQTQIITEDILTGHWSTLKQSGAMRRSDKQALAERVEKLLQAVKTAREEANGVNETETPTVGTAVFGYLFHQE